MKKFLKRILIILISVIMLTTVNCFAADEEETPLPPPATYKFFDYEIEAVESADYFILFLIEQKTYYVLPKRFMNEEKINFLSEFLQRKLEANYKKEN